MLLNGGFNIRQPSLYRQIHTIACFIGMKVDGNLFAIFSMLHHVQWPQSHFNRWNAGITTQLLPAHSPWRSVVVSGVVVNDLPSARLNASIQHFHLITGYFDGLDR